MPTITLPDNSQRLFDKPVNGIDVAGSIGNKLAKDAVAVKVEGELRDLNRSIDEDVRLEVVTRNSDEGLELLRHDAAHVMAQAVKELYPNVQVTIGPSIENGFYYDFAREKSFVPEDLEKIEQRMHEIVDRAIPIEREVWNRDEAVQFFKNWGEHYKAELIAAIPEGDNISIYRQGEWLDLCRGPHLPNTQRLGHAFKLTKLAGAYWRGDAKNAMLQRIYGTAWANEKQLKLYLKRLEEAEKRDHRKLGQQMDLFHIQEESPGSIFWHPKGWTLVRQLIDYMRLRQDEAGYLEVNTPELCDLSLWKKSGHWETFSENMFTSETEDGRIFAIKPMNCPEHVQIFKHGKVKSYRDLPLRISEFGKVHRYEPSGALHGLMRVRGFCQDDAHIFCTEDQITVESIAVCDLLLSIYREFGFEDIHIKFADRPEVRVGEDAVWDKAEKALKQACEAAGVETSINPGEGAFYGPKLEFVLRDAIGRDWQCGTLQVDLNLPVRLGAEYMDDSGEKKHPVMLHRALFGSIERFTGILIEHYAGNLPLWLAPIQLVLCTVVSDVEPFAQKTLQRLRAAGIRCECDFRNETINYKIRDQSLVKTPVIGVIGKREVENDTLTIRRLGSKKQTTLGVNDLIELLKDEIVNKKSATVQV